MRDLPDRQTVRSLTDALCTYDGREKRRYLADSQKSNGCAKYLCWRATSEKARYLTANFSSYACVRDLRQEGGARYLIDR